MTVRQRSHLANSHFTWAFVLMQDQNHICDNLSTTTEHYGIEVDDYNNKVDELTSLSKLLEAEIEMRSKKVEEYKKNHEVERLRADIHRLVTNFVTARARPEKKEEKL
ncbi:hypothetical protein Fot_06363 [Forsythia ovata]|uniref:Uncharacterized protein n=1 Tax=Forsythia ovata TaxID=205694 RepID=A0ABD1WSV0_9LAMI